MALKIETAEHIKKLLIKNGGNKTKTRKELSLSRQQLNDMLEEIEQEFGRNILNEIEQEKEREKKEKTSFEVVGVFPTNEERLAYLDNPQFRWAGRKVKK